MAGDRLAVAGQIDGFERCAGHKTLLSYHLGCSLTVIRHGATPSLGRRRIRRRQDRVVVRLTTEEYQDLLVPAKTSATPSPRKRRTYRPSARGASPRPMSKSPDYMRAVPRVTCSMATNLGQLTRKLHSSGNSGRESAGRR